MNIAEIQLACRFCHSEKGCWTWQCYHCGEIDDVQQPAPPPEQEPVAWMRPSEEGYDSAFRDHHTIVSCAGNPWKGWLPLYTTPPLPVQEPVGEVTEVSDNGFKCEFNQRLAVGAKLYTAPPQRKPLTDEQVKELLLIGPVYASDGVVTRTPFAYRKELLDTALWAFRKAESAHGIKEQP